MSTLKLLRKVEGLDQGTTEYCAEHERKMDYIRHGFVDADFPRAVAYTQAIREATVGFAIADEQGRVLKEFKTLEGAEKARGGARTVLAVEVDDEEQVEEPKVAEAK